jgi:hypothetical protein
MKFGRIYRVTHEGEVMFMTQVLDMCVRNVCCAYLLLNNVLLYLLHDAFYVCSFKIQESNLSLVVLMLILT